MTNFGAPSGPPPGHYRASDGQDYPVPPGYVLGADGQLHAVAPPGPATTTEAAAWEWNAASALVVGGAVGAFIGAFLPWATVGALSVAGTDGDGVLTLILGIAAGALGVSGIRKGKKGLLIGSLVCAALIAIIAGIDIADINSLADGPFGLTAKPGGGIILTLVAGIAGAVGSVLALRQRSS